MCPGSASWGRRGFVRSALTNILSLFSFLSIRTCEECYWTGIRTTRWSRAVYAANLGREYVFPYQNIGRTGYKSDIKALCW